MPPEWTRRSICRMGLASLAGLLSPAVLGQDGPPPAVGDGAAPAGRPEPDLWQLDATELADRIARREVSCVAVIEAHLGRIRAVNGSVNAVTVLLEERARREAERIDRVLAQGGTVGPLAGVPMTVKENVDLVGSSTTEGLAELRDNVVAEDSPHIAQLRQAGAIAIARTNMPDLGLRWHTDSELWGPTRNPWDAAVTPGGSSGGDAVAVATGMAALGLGNDYGGSVRYPAQCCGIAAIRPSRGRVPFYARSHEEHPPLPTFQLFAVQGPMARSVRDLRLALLHMSGGDVRDPTWIPAPLDGPGAQQPARVALTVDPAGRGVDAGVATGVRRAAQALEAAGHTVEEAEPPALEEAARLWNRLVATELDQLVAGQVADIVSPGARDFLRDFLAVNPSFELGEYIGALARRNAIQRAAAAFFERFGLLLGPVSTREPFAVGRDLAGVDAVRELLDSMRLVVGVSCLGYPAVTVPVGLENGVPQAVQIIGPMYGEALCLDAGEVIEKALGSSTPIDPRG